MYQTRFEIEFIFSMTSQQKIKKCLFNSYPESRASTADVCFEAALVSIDK